MGKKLILIPLEKMKLLIDLGIPQGIFLPHERPDLNFLRSKGFLGSEADIVASAAKKSNLLLNQSYSASSMWAANAATFSPSADSQDSIAHITPANLFSMPHRRIEAEFTYQQLNIIFNRSHFKIHKPINSSDLMGDEGAANHLRIANHHLDKGIQIFVYGRDSSQEISNVVARQSKAASEYIANSHKLDMEQTFFLKQNIKAIKSHYGLMELIQKSYDLDYSDERLKTNIELIENALDKVMQLRGVTYNANQIAESFGYINKEKQVDFSFSDNIQHLVIYVYSGQIKIENETI